MRLVLPAARSSAIAVARRSAERAGALGLPAAVFYCTGQDIFLSGRVGHLDEAERRLASLLSGWQLGLAHKVTRSVAGELWTRRGELASAADGLRRRVRLVHR